MRRRGLTVVEVLLGFAIVVVIVAVCFGSVRKMVGRAEGSACAEKLHALGTALALYANDHDGWLPPATTAEYQYREAKEIPAGELEASPALLLSVMKSYVPSPRAWFCPVDPQQGKNVLWLGQRHRLTSYYFFPQTEGERLAWPPKMQLGRDRPSTMPATGEDMPLISDAMGIPAKDSDRQFADDHKARSNHPDGMVNAIRHDLSLSRRRAKEWLGTKE